MSESEDENENFCYFGKPLEPYDEDSFPKRRPISVEEQIATDAQGRRRFHGAFMGGFSAGFFNTVGTPEGWTPNEFKSSRSEKAKSSKQKPEDFMDEEDMGEFGIAPQVVKATKDYNTSKKRKKQVFSDGPIPGEPVLHSILTSGNETVGYLLLKNLGIKDKIKTVSDGKVYGCQMPQMYKISQRVHRDQYEIPEMYKEFLAKPKDNSFGLGYVGLDKNHFSLFPTQDKAHFVVTDKNKKMSITGQAFGVGAFEEEDDDIYIKEDMRKYDFELSVEKEQKETVTRTRGMIFDIFLQSKKPILKNKMYSPPNIPHSFTGKHKVRKSRFEPIVEEEVKPSCSKINPIIRAKYLGEETDKEHTKSKSLQPTDLTQKNETKGESNSEEQEEKPTNSTFDIASLYLNDKFVSSSQNEDVNNILEHVEKLETIHGTDQMREAVRMKMFGGLTRITSDWVPCSLLCKRFNVPEPLVDHPEKTRTRTKNIIFEYQKHVEEESNMKPGLLKEKNEMISPKSENGDGGQIMENRHTESGLIKDSGENSIPNANDQLDEVINREVDSNYIQNTSEVKNETVEDVHVDIIEKIDLEKQQDLYKAVFLSSDSESEDEDSKNEQQNDDKDETRKEEMKSTVLSDQLLPKIKPLKEGILSGVSFHKFSKPQSTVQDKAAIPEKLEQQPEESTPRFLDPDLYGPKLPEKIPVQNYTNVVTISDSEDDWIEKDDDLKKTHKKAKKHKKDKHKKHKHSKKKKSRG